MADAIGSISPVAGPSEGFGLPVFEKGEEALNALSIIQSVGNDVLGAMRAVSNFVQKGASHGICATKIGAVAAMPFDVLAVGNAAYEIYKAPEFSDKALYSTLFLAAVGNTVSDTSTFVQGLDLVAKISQPAVQVFDIMGPIGWALSALGLIHVGYSWHKVNETLDKIDALSPKKNPDKAIGNRLEVFNLFLMDEKGKSLNNSEILSKLRLDGNIPYIESKPKIREHINTLADRYAKTKDPAIAKDFVVAVHHQYGMSKVVSAMRIAAVLTGMIALAFFYIPVLSKYSKLGWVFLAGANVLAISSVVFNKINSVSFLDEIEAMVKKHKKVHDEMRQSLLATH